MSGLGKDKTFLILVLEKYIFCSEKRLVKLDLGLEEPGNLLTQLFSVGLCVARLRLMLPLFILKELERCKRYRTKKQKTKRKERRKGNALSEGN